MDPTRPKLIQIRDGVGYGLAALALGVVWFGALLIPPGTRAFLLESEWWNFFATPLELLVAMCLASLSIALIFRRLIARSRTWRTHLLLAATLPFVGSVIFTWLVILLGSVADRDGAVGFDELIAAMFFIPGQALLTTAGAIYVVAPMGLVSQIVMNRVLVSRERNAI